MRGAQQAKALGPRPHILKIEVSLLKPLLKGSPEITRAYLLTKDLEMHSRAY